ncbi:MAG: NAD-dependent epimerase/dehydratase family protein [Lacunisphaera sp.]
MATYLVTGAAGFIASKVCEFLLVDGNVVIGVDNVNNYYDVHLKHWRVGHLQEKRGFSFYPLDIEHRSSVDRLFATHPFDAVFNLAARAGVRASVEHPELYWSTNVEAERNILEAHVKHGVKKHVLASSSSLYAGCPMPFREDLPIGKPQSPYAETKKAAENLAREYHDKHGIDVSVLRYFTVFGPAGRPDMAPFRFIKWIDEGRPITLFGDGSQARDFTYVDDIAMGTVLAMMPVGFEIFNLGGGAQSADDAAGHQADREGARQEGADQRQANQPGRRAGDLGRHRQGQAHARLVARGFARGRFPPHGRVARGAPGTRARIKV